MIDETATTLALRNRALAVVVATTGVTSIAATSTGFTRAAGSFVTDGFAVGMELLAAGFATAGNNGYKVVTSVSALALGVASLTTMATEAAGGNESLIAGLPEGRAFDNVAFDPQSFAGRPYVEEDFLPGPSGLLGQRNGGLVTETGLYVLKLYGLSGKDVAAIRKTINALKALYAIGTQLTAGAHVLHVGTLNAGPTSGGPYAGQILPQGDGRSVCALTVPWYALSINSIAA
jgi:hypothetical protein